MPKTGKADFEVVEDEGSFFAVYTLVDKRTPTRQYYDLKDTPKDVASAYAVYLKSKGKMNPLEARFALDLLERYTK